MTLKELVRVAIEELVRRGKEEFTTDEIYREVEKIEPGRKRESILATASGLVVGSKHPVYKREDQFLEKVRRGVYKLHKPLEEISRRKKEDRREKKEDRIISLIKNMREEGFSDEEIVSKLLEAVDLIFDGQI